MAYQKNKIIADINFSCIFQTEYRMDSMNDLYIKELCEKLENTEIWDANCKKCEDYTQGIDLLVKVFSKHKEMSSQLFFIGNGGSSAIASHMTADFMKNGGMNTYSLYDNAVTTCMGNDYGYEYIFSKPMEFLVRQDDLVVAISSSGNSQNICNAINVAKRKKATVITFTGFEKDNKAKQLGDINVYVPAQKYGIVESIHNLMLQQVVDYIMERDGAVI
ncbi:MAG: SIS domain-containing protein [Clostridium sp.]|nr:SIS domain-containing protein [Clostridium sp.]